ncbi:hypothetical protein [uncultured Clostridium sp.]|uniref:hypothetical protein n=1 Tax=uncultured Clostridium sp. TaxID=59620 RepID=UPI0025CB975F|nr:hypothetical protein [uncultured Clostridium sp.]MDU4882713.1 hypothetical protein [Clostridium celatum]MDU7076017.1 hypothetical protein [Clostridium celatum]
MLLLKREELEYVFDNEEQAIEMLKELKADKYVISADTRKDFRFDICKWAYIVYASKVIKL